MRPDLDLTASVNASLDPQLLQRLRDLPDGAAPYGYPEFSHRYSRRRVRQAQRPVRLVAAALAVLVGLWVLKHGLGPPLAEDPPMAEMVAQSLPPPGAELPSHWPVLLPTVNAESWLSEHPQRALVRVPAQMAVTELEDQIATLDDQLNAVRLLQPHAQQVAVLQRDRAQLVESLAQVRYAQNLMAGLL